MGKPKIRFKGYTEDWEQRKLGEIAEFNPKSTLPEIFEYVDLESVVGTEMISYKTTNKAEAPSRAQRLAQTGDLFFQTVRPYQKNNYLFEKPDKDYVFSTGYAQMRPCIDGYFLLSSVQTEQFVKSVLDRCTGTSYPAINSSDLSEMVISAPENNEESVRIGDYFRKLDHLITLHHRKCEETKKLKKYMLQKMFPQNGQLVPKIRFAGFTEDWEQRKLIDVCDYVDYRGKTPTKTDSGVFLVTAKNVKDGYIDYGVSQEYISEGDYEEVMRRGKPEIGDVLITTEAPSGNVAQVNRADIALAQRIIKYRGQSNIVDNTYLKCYLLSPEFQNILNAKSSGGTVKGIKGSILHQQEIKYPKYEEQFKIGSYFNNLDHLITLHQRKCDELQNMKKYMLQNMFV